MGYAGRVVEFMNEQKLAKQIIEAIEKIEERVDALSRVVSALAAGLSEDAKAQLESDLRKIKRDVGTLLWVTKLEL